MMLIGQNGEAQKKILKLNVGGRGAHFSEDMLVMRCADSLLAEFCLLTHTDRMLICDTFFEATNEYYFERSSTIFEYIIDFYITGLLHRPIDECIIRYLKELEFWRIPIELISSCCKLSDTFDARRSLALIQKTDFDVFPCPEAAEFDNLCFGGHRKKIWFMFEHSDLSLSGKCLSVVSTAFVLASLAVLILSSIPELQTEHQDPISALIYAEICCMAWFTSEFLIRFVISPRKCTFLKSTLNLIDLLTILPFYIELMLPLIGVVKALDLRNFRGTMIAIRIMRLARVTRIFKLARYSSGLRAFGETMQKSAAELSMLGVFLLTGVMLFSTAIYSFEREEPGTKFYSIPAACWWCVITMTTVGYGDLVPLTCGGKLIAATASVCGIIVLAFPISMIIDKFAESTAQWRSPADSGLNSGRRRTRRYMF